MTDFLNPQSATGKEKKRKNSQQSNPASSRRSSRAMSSDDGEPDCGSDTNSSFERRVFNLEPVEIQQLKMKRDWHDNVEMKEANDDFIAFEAIRKLRASVDLNNNLMENNMTDEEIVRDIDENKIIELKEAFDLFDINSDGLITHADLKMTFISLGLDVPDEEITKMLEDGRSPLDEDAFIKMVGKKTVHLEPECIMSEALSKWDRDNSGLIPFSTIRQDLMAAGDRFTEKEADYALEEAPIVVINGRKMIDYREFCKELFGIKKSNVHQ